MCYQNTHFCLRKLLAFHSDGQFQNPFLSSLGYIVVDCCLQSLSDKRTHGSFCGFLGLGQISTKPAPFQSTMALIQPPNLQDECLQISQGPGSHSTCRSMFDTLHATGWFRFPSVFLKMARPPSLYGWSVPCWVCALPFLHPFVRRYTRVVSNSCLLWIE